MPYLVISFLSSLAATILILRYESLHSRYSYDDDMVGVQKFHGRPVPRIGGIGVFLGILCGQFSISTLGEGSNIFGLFLILSSLPAFFVGILEDLTKKVSVRLRLGGTILSAASGGILLDGWLSRFDIPGLDWLLSFAIVAIFVTCFAVAGVANAFNLIDGYNGLTGMVAVIILLGLAYVSSEVSDYQITMAALISVGAILGFLFLNYPKGLIFLGDGGAYLVGFVIAELSVLLVARNPVVSPWFPLLLSFYPIFESLFTIFRRLVVGKRHPGLPDAAHLHQLIYRRLVRWAVGSDCELQKRRRNSLTSPYLWLISSYAVVPSIMFWNSTYMLMIFSALFACSYSYIYRKLYTGKFPKWLVLNKKILTK